MIMLHKICFFINQHLVCYSYEKTKTLIVLLLVNHKGYIVL